MATEETSLAWWLPSTLREHPPRPWVAKGWTPSKRTDRPAVMPIADWTAPTADWTPLPHVFVYDEDKQRWPITFYALEVFDAPLLHELLHLKWLENDDQRYFHGPDGEGWESAWRVADENVKLVKAAMDRDRAMLKANRSVIAYIDPHGRERNVNLTHDEAELAYLRAKRDRYRDATGSSTKEERQVTRERLAVLVETLHDQAGWTLRDVAELIIAAETDWTRAPILHIDDRRRGDADDRPDEETGESPEGDLAGNIERWIIDRRQGK